MDIELQAYDKSKDDSNQTKAGDNSPSWSKYTLDLGAKVTGLEPDCLLATVSYYLRSIIWTAFLYFYVGGIGAIAALYTLRAILGYLFLLVFLVLLRIYCMEYYLILKWFATPSVIFLKSWTSLFFFAYLVLLPSDLHKVSADQVVSWLFQVFFGNIVSLILTVLIINVILFACALFLPKEGDKPKVEDAAPPPSTVSNVPSIASAAESEVAKDFSLYSAPSPSVSTEQPSMAASSAARRESAMSTTSAVGGGQFALDSALGRLSLQAFGEAKYLQFAVAKGSRFAVDEVAATIREEEPKKTSRLSLRQAVHSNYNIGEMVRQQHASRGSLEGAGGGLKRSSSSNSIGGFGEVTRESLVIDRNNAHLMLVHNVDDVRSSMSRLSAADRASLVGVTVKPVVVKAPRPLSTRPSQLTRLPAKKSSGDNLSAVHFHHAVVRPKSSPRTALRKQQSGEQQSSPTSSPKSSPLSDRKLPSIPARTSQDSDDSDGGDQFTTNPLSAAARPPRVAVPPQVPSLTLDRMASQRSQLDVIEEEEDEDRSTEVSRKYTLPGDKEPEPLEDYEMEYPEEASAAEMAAAAAEEEGAVTEEAISIALPFIPTMGQLFTFWKYIAIVTALITFLMPNKTKGAVVCFQLAVSVLAFIQSTTFRTALIAPLPWWLQMPLQSFVIFTPIVIIMVLLSSTEGVHDWQGCLNQYIVSTTGVVRGFGNYGAGNFLVMFLNPTIVSLSFATVEPIMEFYQLMPLIVPAVVVSCFIITIQNASVSKMLLSSSTIAFPLLIRTVTIPIAIAIGTEISADIGITVASVLVNAVLALRLFPMFLTKMKVTSPVVRGVSCGVCGTLLGVVSLDDQGETVAAGIGMAGFGIATITFGLIFTIAAFRDFVCQLA